MNSIFLLLFLASLVCLVIGLIKPSAFKKFFKEKTNRKNVGLSFSTCLILFFILFGVTIPATPTTTQTVASTVTSSVSVATQTTAPVSKAKTITPVIEQATPSAPVVQETPAPTPTTLTDTEYAQQYMENVNPFFSAAVQDIQSGTSSLGTGDTTNALSDFQQAQSDIAQAQSGMQALQGDVPANALDEYALVNKAYDEYSKGINLIISDLNNNNLNVNDSQIAGSEINQGNLDIHQAVAYMTQINAQNQYGQ